MRLEPLLGEVTGGSRHIVWLLLVAAGLVLLLGRRRGGPPRAMMVSGHGDHGRPARRRRALDDAARAACKTLSLEELGQATGPLLRRALGADLCA